MTSSRDSILAAIRKNTGTRYDKPELNINGITWPDKLAHFSEVLEAAGGEAVVLEEGQTVDDVIKRLFADAKSIASNLPDVKSATFNPDKAEDPHELNQIDLSVIKGEFAVAENGAVWITKNVRHKAVYFVSTSLLVLVDRKRIVNNMHEAYKEVGDASYDYGLFMSGPSKTADIEQALVFGAHGPMRVVVLFV